MRQRQPEVGELFSVNHTSTGRWLVIREPGEDGRAGSAICVRDRDGKPYEGESPAGYWPEDVRDYGFAYDEAATIEFYLFGELL